MINTYNSYFNAPCSILFACAYDKNIENIAPLFFENMKIMPTFFYCTKPGDIKMSDLVRLSNAVKPLCKKHNVAYDINEDYLFAIDSALKHAAKTNGILLVCGSFYLIAECKNICIYNCHLSQCFFKFSCNVFKTFKTLRYGASKIENSLLSGRRMPKRLA